MREGKGWVGVDHYYLAASGGNPKPRIDGHFPYIPYPPHANNRRILFQEKNTPRNLPTSKIKKNHGYMCVWVFESKPMQSSGIIPPRSILLLLLQQKS